MKKLLKLFGIIALVAIVGFSVAACGGDDSGGNSGGENVNAFGIVSANLQP